jgi:hypothetical protein
MQKAWLQLQVTTPATAERSGLFAEFFAILLNILILQKINL